MSDFVQVVTTTETLDQARRIAEGLVRQRLAACVQIVGPVESWFWWEGEVQSGPEWRCLIKTRRPLWAQVEAAIRELHPYETPQIIGLELVAGGEDYLAWLEAETREPPGVA